MCVLYYDLHLQRIVACVYTVTALAALCIILTHSIPLNIQCCCPLIDLPMLPMYYTAARCNPYFSSYCYPSMPNNPTAYWTLGSPLPTMPPSMLFSIFKLQGPTPWQMQYFHVAHWRPCISIPEICTPLKLLYKIGGLCLNSWQPYIPPGINPVLYNLSPHNSGGFAFHFFFYFLNLTLTSVPTVEYAQMRNILFSLSLHHLWTTWELNPFNPPSSILGPLPSQGNFIPTTLVAVRGHWSCL